MTKPSARLTLGLVFALASVGVARSAPLFDPLVSEAQLPSPYVCAKFIPISVSRVPAKKVKKSAPHATPVVKSHPLAVHVLRVTASAYSLHGRTARGTRPSLGTIAVDPRLIPLGTRVFVPGYGWGRALDTGGSIHGCVIDLWMPNVARCYRWGVRTVKILVETVEPPHVAVHRPVHIARHDRHINRHGRLFPIELASRKGRILRPHVTRTARRHVARHCEHHSK